ncbi:hypothetical protein AVEN_154134-1 [Araneus ventricosus]|uniref:Uncharacterized protein n=1 Tax=Araneus ventricosus TaxID=182803 RepID=A0A4Y2MVD1_ARAVE|nr:hypothetical protein AVEN_154134-1 [Araneus ventricosus]
MSTTYKYLEYRSFFSIFRRTRNIVKKLIKERQRSRNLGLVVFASRFEATRRLFWGLDHIILNHDQRTRTAPEGTSAEGHSTPTDLKCTRPFTRWFFSGIWFRTLQPKDLATRATMAPSSFGYTTISMIR